MRTHESGGHIHFHVDSEGLKAEVPVAEWWSAWRRLQHLGKFTWLDTKNRTLLAVVTWIDDDGLSGDTVRLSITVRACNPSFSLAFDQMDRTTGR